MTGFGEIAAFDSKLEAIIGKVADGRRLSFMDGLILENTDDILTVCRLADAARELKHGSNTGYISNVHINYTNVCKSRCKFCAFWRAADSEDAYTLSVDEAIERVPKDVQEIHIVGGLNPSLPLEYFTELLGAMKENFPKAVLKAFTAVEIHDLSVRIKKEPGYVLKMLKDAGLGMLPGGGAEIFDEEIRKEVCPNKATSVEWLNIHRIAHEMGIKSNSTMLHGHIENARHRINHLLRLRELQDETGGFIAHIPLPYLNENNELSGKANPVNGSLDIRQVAVARLILDNIPHIKAYWRVLGVRMAQTALRAGADDIDGTVDREDIMHEAGSSEPRGLSLLQLKQLIKGAGLVPEKRNAFHESIEEVSV